MKFEDKNEKEKKNDAEALPNRDRNRFPHRSSFVNRLVFILSI